ELLFAQSMLPTIIPRLVLLAVLVGAAVLGAGTMLAAPAGGKRRRRTGLLGRLVGSPLTSASALRRSTRRLGTVMRGAAPRAGPPPLERARGYVGLVADTLGRPGFRELLVTVHDEDARRDLVFALLGPPWRQRFFEAQGTGKGDRHACLSP